jgi:hypothetical protein
MAKRKDQENELIVGIIMGWEHEYGDIAIDNIWYYRINILSILNLIIANKY